MTTILFMNEGTAVALSIIFIIILSLLSYSTYFSFNTIDGEELSCIDTVKNIFGILKVSTISTLQKVGLASESVGNKIISAGENLGEKVLSAGETIGKTIEKPIQDLKELREKEVFNIDNNAYTYDEAPLVCQSFNAELATLNQVNDAYNKGANWCNYGWIQNQMAVFPIQHSFYDALHKSGDKNKDKCGSPGINGGFFKDKSLKFGVNCYGYKPSPDPAKIVYLNHVEKHDPLSSNIVSALDTMNPNAAKLKKIKDDIYNKSINIRPFNDNKWSTYSYKKSIYVINPYTNEQVSVPLSDDDKHPNKLDVSSDTYNDDNNTIDKLSSNYSTMNVL